MLEILNNRTALKFAASITVGLLIAKLTSLYHWEFWALIFLWWLSERLSFQSGVEKGVCIGVALPNKQRNEVKKLIEDDQEDSE